MTPLLRSKNIIFSDHASEIKNTFCSEVWQLTFGSRKYAFLKQKRVFEKQTKRRKKKKRKEKEDITSNDNSAILSLERWGNCANIRDDCEDNADQGQLPHSEPTTMILKH